MIAATISQNGGFINSMFAQVGEYKLNQVLDYWDPSPSQNMYPLVMLQHIGETNGWHALQNIYGTMFEFDIVGLMAGMDPNTLGHAIEKFAASITQIFAARNSSLVTEDGEAVVYIEPGSSARGYFPITNIRYTESYGGQTLSRGFKARYKCSVFQGAPDIEAYANSLIGPEQI